MVGCESYAVLPVVEALRFDPIFNISLEDKVAFDLVFVASGGVMVVAKEHSNKEFTGEHRNNYKDLNILNENKVRETMTI